MSKVTISFPLHDSLTSAGHEYLTRFTPKRDVPPSSESDLLKAIRSALRGADTEDSSEVHSTTFSYNNQPGEEEELAWNSYSAVLSRGGVIVKKWSFQEERQSIQWACLGWLEQYTSTNPTSSHAAPGASNDATARSSDEESRTFGPFAQTRQGKKSDVGTLTREPAVFVFLRSIGRIYLKNGLDYTFALPFVVRRAWALQPHGVMIQRVLEPSERLEAKTSGDELLPTIFTITNPFAEAAAVGLTNGIVGGFGGEPSALKDELEVSQRPLRSIPPAEMIVWTSSRSPGCKYDITISVDVEKNLLSVWRYTYQKPKDTPVPLTQSPEDVRSKKRQSFVGTHSRRSSAAFLGHTFLPKTRSPDTSPNAAFLELPALASLPGMPVPLAATQSLASLGSGGSSQPGHLKMRRSSLTRNDLSMTMDKMALGGRIEGDLVLVPVEHGRMKAAFWMERLYSTQIEQSDVRSWRQIKAAIFDHRWDGISTRSLLGICLPKAQSLVIYSLAPDQDQVLRMAPVTQLLGTSLASLRVTRPDIWDVVVVKPDHSLVVLTHGVREVPVVLHTVHGSLEGHSQMSIDIDSMPPTHSHGPITEVESESWSSLIVTFSNGDKTRVTMSLLPQDDLTRLSLRALSLAMPEQDFFQLHYDFLSRWFSGGLSPNPDAQFDSLIQTIYSIFGLESPKTLETLDPWAALARSPSHKRFFEDPVLRKLQAPRP